MVSTSWQLIFFLFSVIMCSLISLILFSIINSNNNVISNNMTKFETCTLYVMYHGQFIFYFMQGSGVFVVEDICIYFYTVMFDSRLANICYPLTVFCA